MMSCLHFVELRLVVTRRVLIKPIMMILTIVYRYKMATTLCSPPQLCDSFVLLSHPDAPVIALLVKSAHLL